MEKWVSGQMDKIGTPIEKMNSDKFQSNSNDFLKYISIYIEEQEKIKAAHKEYLQLIKQFPNSDYQVTALIKTRMLGRR